MTRFGKNSITAEVAAVLVFLLTGVLLSYMQQQLHFFSVEADRSQHLRRGVGRQRCYHKIEKSHGGNASKEENRYRRLKEGLRGVIEEYEPCSPF